MVGKRKNPPTKKVLCYITSKEYKKKFYDDETPVIKELKKRGVEVRKSVWTEPCDFSSSSLAVIRTPWDYHTNYEKFLAFLKDASTKLTIANNVEIVERNSHKFYLRDIQDQGVPIVPTEFLEKGTTAEQIGEIIKKRGWDELVFKPAVGASAFGLCKLSKDKIEKEIEGKEKKSKEFEECLQLLENVEGLLQPFQSSVCTKGELSLVFFNKKFAHAMIKMPAKGDYRVQGGTKALYSPSPACIDIALRALSAFSGDIPILYARLEDEYLVTEVELIEPALFFKLAPPSSTIAFADAICEMLDNPNPKLSSEQAKQSKTTSE